MVLILITARYNWYNYAIIDGVYYGNQVIYCMC